MMSLSEIFAIFLCVSLVSIGFAGQGGLGVELNNIKTECFSVAGEITHKDETSGIPILYVKLNDNGKTENYIVYVSPSTYLEYEVGDAWNDEICEIAEYSNLRKFIDTLTEAGILEMI